MKVRTLPYQGPRTNAPNRVPDSIWNPRLRTCRETGSTPWIAKGVRQGWPLRVRSFAYLRSGQVGDLRRGSSRTLVMILAGCWRYRFSCRTAPECRDARSAWLPKLEETGVAAAARGRVDPCSFVEFAGGHADRRLQNARCRSVLLPLREDEGDAQLRADVRVAEVCDALVGDFVQQAAETCHARQSRGGATLEASRSRGARPAIVLAGNADYEEESPGRDTALK